MEDDYKAQLPKLQLSIPLLVLVILSLFYFVSIIYSSMKNYVSLSEDEFMLSKSSDSRK